MDTNKVEKIQKLLLENPELHVKLVESLRDFINKLDDTFTPEELFVALKATIQDADTEEKCGTTYKDFWGHY